MGQNNDVLIIGEKDAVVEACAQFGRIKPIGVPDFRLLDTSTTFGTRVFCGAVAAVSFSFVPYDHLYALAQDHQGVRMFIMKDDDDTFQPIEQSE